MRNHHLTVSGLHIFSNNVNTTFDNLKIVSSVIYAIFRYNIIISDICSILDNVNITYTCSNLQIIFGDFHIILNNLRSNLCMIVSDLHIIFIHLSKIFGYLYINLCDIIICISFDNLCTIVGNFNIFFINLCTIFNNFLIVLGKLYIIFNNLNNVFSNIYIFYGHFHIIFYYLFLVFDDLFLIIGNLNITFSNLYIISDNLHFILN